MILSEAGSPLKSISLMASLAFLLPHWSVLVKRPLVRTSTGPTKPQEPRKKGKYRQVPGQVSSGHTFYILQERNSDPTAMLHSI